jgi:hypothetical protein
VAVFEFDSGCRDPLAGQKVEVAPGRGFEPRTLRLTDRCGTFRNGDLNSLSAAEYHHFPPFITGVAVRVILPVLDMRLGYEILHRDSMRFNLRNCPSPEQTGVRA